MINTFALRMMAPEGGAEGGAEPVPQNNQQATTPQFDYEKLASIIAGKQTVTEDTVLKNYFKQQGMSQADAESAISAFKQQKAQYQPDVNALQAQLSQAQANAQRASVESAATIAAVGLGIDVKTIPYVLKMADLSQVVGADGKINDDTLKNAINKVLEDIPALKPQASQLTGFLQVGASGNGQQASNDDALRKAFGI